MRNRLLVFLSVIIFPAVVYGQQTRVTSAAGSRPDGTAGLGDRLIVRVQNAEALFTETAGCKGVVLFLSDMAVPNLPPETCDTRTGEIRFLLD